MERRYVEPPPRVLVIDFATATKEDRFSPPKASIAFSPDGKHLFGIEKTKPSCRVLRYAADAATAAACAAAEERQARRPAGRRHDAYLLYLEGLRRNETDWGLNAFKQAQTSPARGVYKAQLGGSEGVANCLVWHSDQERQQEGDAEEGEEGGMGTPTQRRRRCLVLGEGQVRPSTAPAAANPCPTSLDMWNTVPCASASPRFRSRTIFEQRRAATPDTDAIKRSGYLARHQQQKVVQASKEAQEAELLRTWPHGLPRSELRRACAAGLRVTGLGIGGNPLSMARRQYLALRPGMKWYM